MVIFQSIDPKLEKAAKRLNGLGLTYEQQIKIASRCDGNEDLASLWQKKYSEEINKNNLDQRSSIKLASNYIQAYKLSAEFSKEEKQKIADAYSSIVFITKDLISPKIFIQRIKEVRLANKKSSLDDKIAYVASDLLNIGNKKFEEYEENIGKTLGNAASANTKFFSRSFGKSHERYHRKVYEDSSKYGLGGKVLALGIIGIEALSFLAVSSIQPHAMIYNSVQTISTLKDLGNALVSTGYYALYSGLDSLQIRAAVSGIIGGGVSAAAFFPLIGRAKLAATKAPIKDERISKVYEKYKKIKNIQDQTAEDMASSYVKALDKAKEKFPKDTSEKDLKKIARGYAKLAYYGSTKKATKINLDLYFDRILTAKVFKKNSTLADRVDLAVNTELNRNNRIFESVYNSPASNAANFLRGGLYLLGYNDFADYLDNSLTTLYNKGGIYKPISVAMGLVGSIVSIGVTAAIILRGKMFYPYLTIAATAAISNPIGWALGGAGALVVGVENLGNVYYGISKASHMSYRLVEDLFYKKTEEKIKVRAAIDANIANNSSWYQEYTIHAFNDNIRAFFGGKEAKERIKSRQKSKEEWKEKNKELKKIDPGLSLDNIGFKYKNIKDKKRVDSYVEFIKERVNKDRNRAQDVKKSIIEKLIKSRLEEEPKELKK